MRNIRWLTALAVLALAACGGGSGSCNSTFSSCGKTGTTASTVATVLLVSNTPTIPSDNSLSANITAYVRDANNNFLPNIPVIFTTDTGTLGVTLGTTNANGVATATLSTLGNPANRTVSVTATAGGVAQTATVAVVGSALAIQGPIALTAGQEATYTVQLADSGGHGIPNTAITVTAPANVSVSATALTTDLAGRATFTGTGGSSGTGSLGVAGLGLTNALTIVVNGDALTFTAPAANTNIPLRTLQVFTVHWLSNGTAVVGQPINFATTRGCIVAAGFNGPCTNTATVPPTVQPSTGVATTDASGNASVILESDNAGGATVTATTATGTTTSFSTQFIATVAASIVVQPDLFTLAPNQPTNLTAVVRDTNNNLVTNATVVFSLSDITGGTLSTPSVITNLQGRAQTVYTAGTVSSAANGVKITATVQNAPAVTNTVSLTVAATQLFISIGTGNTIIANASGTQYQKDYVVQVTDSTGAGVKGVNLSMSVLPDWYYKGYRKFFSTTWLTCYTVPADMCAGGSVPTLPVDNINGCANEDINHNGILDPGEDQNGNGKLDPGNIALVSPSTITTDANGFAIVSVYYPEEYAYYVEETLQAQASVQGTAFASQSVFLLPGLSDDFNNQTKAPPGPVSAFGRDNSCTDTN